MNKRTLTLLALAGITTIATAQTTTYGAYSGEETIGVFGTNKQENYDVAIRVAGDGLVGKQLTGVRVHFPEGVENISEAKAFISKELNIEKTVFTPDGQTKEFTPVEGFVEVTFDTPYTITDEGIFVGYSFTEDATVAKPISVVGSTDPDLFYLHSSRTYRSRFVSKAEDLGKNLAMQAIIDGLPANAAMPESAEAYIEAGSENNTFSFRVLNQGCTPMQSVDVNYSVAGQQGTAHINFDTPVTAHYNAAGAASFVLPKIADSGTFPITLTVTKVNGADNEAATGQASGYVHSMNFVPKKRALLEEYTGTWCRWCPRGFVGLEHMNELLGNDFVGVSYHNGDPMGFADSYPNNVTGFPDAWIDRKQRTDAYCGDNYDGHFNIDKTYAKACEGIAAASIDCKAFFTSNSQKTVSAQATVRFPVAYADSPYQLGFLLTADGLSGSGDNWEQSNYYSGQGGSYPDEDMTQFTDGDSYMSGLIYNFVVVGYNGTRGIESSHPQSIEADKSYTYDFSFDLRGTTANCDPSIIQDKSKLNVVALLIDSTTGYVANAIKVKVYDSEANGVKSVSQTDADQATPVAYYSADGRAMAGPQKGLNIVRMSNGRTVKVVRK